MKENNELIKRAEEWQRLARMTNGLSVLELQAFDIIQDLLTALKNTPERDDLVGEEFKAVIDEELITQLQKISKAVNERATKKWIARLITDAKDMANNPPYAVFPKPLPPKPIEEGA